MNRNTIGCYVMILMVLTIGLIYSAPNLYSPDPAIQVTGHSSSKTISEAVFATATQALKANNIAYFGEELTDNNAQVRLKSPEDQLKAKQVLQSSLGHDYVVALNLAPTTPQWLQAFGAEPMKLGLDLRGGVHFLLQVDTELVIKKYLETQSSELKKALRDVRARYRDVQIDDNSLLLSFSKEEWRTTAINEVRQNFPSFTREKTEEGDTYLLRLRVLEDLVKEKEDYAVNQNLTTLRNRVNELGVSEPIVQRQGRSRIVVELPGVQDTAAAKRIIGKTANLEFRLEALPGDKLPKEAFEFRSTDDVRRTAILEKSIVITGDQVSNASSGYDENNQAQVNISLDSDGGRAMNMATRNNVGRNLAVLFIETRTRSDEVRNDLGEMELVDVRYEDKKIINLATVRSALGISFRITGLDNPTEASELALLLRAGALAAPMYFVQESTIGPSLGAENIAMGINSVQIGMLLVVFFMLAIYRVLGFVANLALALNLVLLAAIMSVMGATLTLPGIAGIVLTLGMAVDANVLIFSRIKEELNAGLSPQMAINSGYERAHVSIVDANLTTLIVAVILYAIGTGPVQGFAVVLSIGILTSMFTSIIGTRILVNLIFGGRDIKSLWI